MTRAIGSKRRGAAGPSSWYRWTSRGLAMLSLPGLAVWVHLTLGWGTLLAPWRDLPPATLALLLCLMLASYLLRAIRLYDYLFPILGHAPLATLRLSLLHNLFNNLLPMRTGEAAFPLLMKRYFGERYGASAASLLWLRLIDLTMLIGICLAVILLAPAATASPPLPRALAATGLVLAVALLLMLPLLRRPAARRVASANDSKPRASSTRARRLLLGLLREIVASLPASPVRYTRLVLWSLLSWVTKLLAFLWLVTLFADLPAAQAMLGVAAAELSSVLPIHGLAGTGTYEGAMVAALALTGTDPERALLAAVNLHLFLLASAILFGAAARLLPTPRAGERPAMRTIG